MNLIERCDTYHKGIDYPLIPWLKEKALRDSANYMSLSQCDAGDRELYKVEQAIFKGKYDASDTKLLEIVLCQSKGARVISELPESAIQSQPKYRLSDGSIISINGEKILSSDGNNISLSDGQVRKIKAVVDNVNLKSTDKDEALIALLAEYKLFDKEYNASGDTITLSYDEKSISCNGFSITLSEDSIAELSEIVISDKTEEQKAEEIFSSFFQYELSDGVIIYSHNKTALYPNGSSIDLSDRMPSVIGFLNSNMGVRIKEQAISLLLHNITIPDNNISFEDTSSTEEIATCAAVAENNNTAINSFCNATCPESQSLYHSPSMHELFMCPMPIDAENQVV